MSDRPAKDKKPAPEVKKSATSPATEKAVVAYYDAKHLKKAGELVQSLRDKHKEEVQNASKIIEEQTALEREALEKAYKKYEKKVREVMASEKVQEARQKIDAYEEQIEDVIEKVSVAYRQAVRYIRRSTDLTDEQKMEQIENLEQAINNALLSKEQKAALEFIQQHVGSLVSGQPPLKQGRQGQVLRIMM